uniref:Uncharacterized protein n=1 Tax=Anguilla anguilla TaxID=7936 RepID=A0A0E9TUT7_ANGAN
MSIWWVCRIKHFHPLFRSSEYVNRYYYGLTNCKTLYC